MKSVRVSLARAVILAATLVSVSALPASATVVFDSFDAGVTFHPADNLVAATVSRSNGGPIESTRLAAHFTVTGGNYALTSITVPISEQKDVPDDIHRLRITTDVGGSPGATLEVLSENQGVWPTITNPFTTATTLLSTTHPVLLDGASYWVVSEPTSVPGGGNFFVEFRWSMSTSGPQVTVQQQGGGGELPSDPWPGGGGTARMALRVDGTATTDVIAGSWGRIKHMYR